MGAAASASSACCEGGLEDRLRVLEATTLVLHLSGEQLEQLCAYFSWRRAAVGASIVTQGHAHGTLFVIARGAVAVQLDRAGGVTSTDVGATGSEAKTARRIAWVGAAIVPPNGSATEHRRSSSVAAGVRSVLQSLRQQRSSNALTTQGVGSFFGQHELLEKGRRAPATVTARTACRMLCMTRASLERLRRDKPETCEVFVSSLGDRMEAHLSSIPLFSSVARHNIRLLASMLHFVALDADEPLFHEGDPGNSMYIVYKGRARAVAVDAATGNEHLLNTFEPGAFFGEIGLMVDVPRTATIVAEGRCVLLELSKDDFEAFLELSEDAALEQNITDLMKKRIAESFRKYSIPFMSAIPSDKFTELSQLCTIQNKPADDVVYREGDPSTHFYLIAHGKCDVEVTKRRKGTKRQRSGGAAAAIVYNDSSSDDGGADNREEKTATTPTAKTNEKTKKDGGSGGGSGGREEEKTFVLSTLGEGDYFGELALFEEEERTATVVARTRCVLISVEAHAFRRFLQTTAPEALAEFTLQQEGYMIGIDAVLNHSLGLQFFRKYLESEFSSENLSFFLSTKDFGERYGSVDALSSSSPSPRSAPGRAGPSVAGPQMEQSFRMAPNAVLGSSDDAERAADARFSGDDEDVMSDRHSDTSEMFADATAIAEKFIVTSAPDEVNIQHHTRRHVIADLTRSHVHPDIFVEARREIYKLLKTDPFTRFKQSEIFKRFLEAWRSMNERRAVEISKNRRTAPANNKKGSGIGVFQRWREAFASEKLPDLSALHRQRRPNVARRAANRGRFGGARRAGSHKRATSWDRDAEDEEEAPEVSPLLPRPAHGHTRAGTASTALGSTAEFVFDREAIRVIQAAALAEEDDEDGDGGEDEARLGVPRHRRRPRRRR